jgi:primosomal protein N' (replication factor Y)
MARLIVRSENEEAAGKFADELAAAFQEAIKRVSADVRLLGPAECPVFKLKNYYRFHFQVQSPSSAALHDAIRTAIAIPKPVSGVEFQIDVDPYNML